MRCGIGRNAAMWSSRRLKSRRALPEASWGAQKREGRRFSSRRPFFMHKSSHVRIVRPAAAFGRDPDDVLRRVLDIAGLAMHAVLRVDLQALVAVVGFDEFV